MKKSIKILVAFILASSFWSIAHGQSASISANATVINEIAVARVADLNFGTLVAGQIKSIDMMGNVSISSGTALGSTTRGEFTVSASAGSDVRLSFDLPNNLTGSGSDVLPISFSWMDEMGYPEYSVFILEQDGNGGSFFDPTSGSYAFAGNSFPTFEAISGVNSVRVFIGGQVDATNVSSGTYNGTITLNATYN